jgi:leucine-rich repeat protein SHOC2
LPPEIGNLTNLKVLDVSNNFLSQLPDEIGRLENLITLDAGRNVYCNISPEIFGQLKKLERLDFAGCNIEKIPDNLLELPRLRELHVSKVEPGPQSEVLWKLTNLTTLSIGFLRDEGQLAAGIGRLINLEELSLAGSCLQVIPNEIGRLSRLKSLDLSDNSYQFSLPPEIANLTRLKTLNLQGCELKQFPAVITKLEGLESLNLRDNSFSELPSEFWNLTNLKSLRMGTWDGYKAFSAHLTPEIANFRNLVELDLEGMVNLTDDEVPQNNVLSALGTLTKLEKLNLSYTELSDLSWIGDLTSLRELNCAFTSLKVIPSEIRNLKFLQTADFSFCGALTRMSIDVGQLKKLLILDLTGCGGIESLPAQIGRLRSLQELRFDSTLTYSLGPRPLTTLPKEIGQLKNLEVLRLRDHNLSALPIEIGGLMRLKELQLSGNKLTSLPIEIGGLMRLKELQLSGNKLTSLPESIGTLSNLRQIDCSDNQLESLPSTIGGLRELAELSLHNNRLKTLPPQIGQLAKLNRLSLKGNKIESLPVEIGKLKQLNKLDLAGQQLTELPRTIGDLERLRHLNLASNRLDSLPRSIGKLKQLEVLGIGGNLLKDLPAELQNLNNLIVLDIAGNELNRSALESLTKIDRLEELWLTNYTLTFSYLSDAWLGVSKAEKKAEREAERKKKLAKYFGDSSEIAGEAKPQSDTVQLKLPPFPEGTGPSEKAIAFLSKHGDFENGVFIEKYIAKDGKAGTRKAKFYKLPKNMVSSNHLSEMTGYVIAFNQFIPLPKWDFNDRLITFYADSRRGPNAFMFGYDPDKARHQFYICMKRNTSNTTYLMKNFAYKFEEGGSIFNCCRGADNNPIDACVFGKKTDGNSADIARNLTRPAYNSDSPPLFSYFAPKGMTAWEAIQDAEEKMKEKENELRN